MKLRIQELCPQRAYTRDAAPSRDTLLAAERLTRNPAMLGRVWAGDFTARIGELSSSSDRAIAIDEAQRALAAYGQSLHAGSTLRPGNAGSLGTGADLRPEEVFDIGPGADPADINSANKMFWADRAPRTATRDVPPPRGGCHAVSIDAINEANRAFWARQTAHQKSPDRQWGKG